MASAMWLYYIIKIVDLLDTVCIFLSSFFVEIFNNKTILKLGFIRVKKEAKSNNIFTCVSSF